MDKCKWEDGEFKGCEDIRNEIREELDDSIELGILGNYCKWCGADIIKPKEDPITIRSGKTWVKCQDGVNYLWTGKKIENNDPDFLPSITDVNWIAYRDSGGYNLLELTDEIAKLRPIVITYDKDMHTLWGMSLNQMALIENKFTCKPAWISTHKLRLTTAKELSDG